ncbi:MAG: zinc metallopeptidase [Chloroherpetonaceae bacterium]|nr:zinc metallopeptidase [Chthonomonadaceae bacterium]MDW8209124.1 zinc metallopeptidase [Chloroherpetonaceae bacterium]
MLFDPLYLVFALPPLLLGLWAQWRVHSAVSRYSEVVTAYGLTGAEVARRLLDAAGLYHVQVEPVPGHLTDHYDPRTKTLRLSEAVYGAPTVAAAGIAAHEMGHALQDAQNYGPLVLRSAMVPTVQFGSWLGPLLFMIGLFTNMIGLAWLGLLLFGAVAAFTLVTLPVEYDASRRAKALLHAHGLVSRAELRGVDAVLDAAALTYVAAAAQAIGNLLYYVVLLTGGGRSRD